MEYVYIITNLYFAQLVHYYFRDIHKIRLLVIITMQHLNVLLLQVMFHLILPGKEIEENIIQER